MRLDYRCAIIGAGPAGLAAAVKFVQEGMTDFILIEREAETGGILNQCIHNGFGLELYREDLTGPEFALRLSDELKDMIGQSAGKPHEGPVILASSMVKKVERRSGGGFTLSISSKRKGLLALNAEAVLTATGCRERTRENIEVAGSRPAGIFTAGQAQNLINRKHYAPGKRVIIQGSGDIGLIMARRLTIEGFQVVAVLERLPWLSGLIRNKVQCLDHFGISLHLNRQITEIRGRNRVSSVESAATDADGRIIPGTEINFDCDTVLFAVGLIPELESVKPAGIRLPDRFHPSVNGLYETNVPGLFAAGNCLHINDLADSAAAEGASAAEKIVGYLANPSDFRLGAEKAEGLLPYTVSEPDVSLDADFFSRLEKDNCLVCIVCPKGCPLSEGEYGCRRGEEYFRKTASPAGGYSQRVSTTIETGTVDSCGRPIIVPAVSADEIPVKLIPEVVEKLKETASAISSPEKITVTASGNEYLFSLCRTD